MTSIFKETLDEIFARVDAHFSHENIERMRADMKDGIRKRRYQQFMESDEWKHIRGLKLDLASHRCEKCGVGDPLDVHHLTYDRFGGDELLTDLQVLCRECHEAAHGRKFGVGYPERDMYIEYRTFES